jgi:hypothetical protein
MGNRPEGLTRKVKEEEEEKNFPLFMLVLLSCKEKLRGRRYEVKNIFEALDSCQTRSYIFPISRVTYIYISWTRLYSKSVLTLRQ